MNTQIVTIHMDGSISGLQRKPGQGLDLTKLGRAEIKRASEIVWVEEHQQWMISILTGQHAGKVVTHTLCEAHGFNPFRFVGDWSCQHEDDRIMFPDYDDAVRGEIAFLDHLRVRGEYTG